MASVQTTAAAPANAALPHTVLRQEGFVANTAASVNKARHSQPPVGGKILLEMYKKYKASWMVELLYDDLLDWNGWPWGVAVKICWIHTLPTLIETPTSMRGLQQHWLC